MRKKSLFGHLWAPSLPHQSFAWKILIYSWLLIDTLYFFTFAYLLTQGHYLEPSVPLHKLPLLLPCLLGTVRNPPSWQGSLTVPTWPDWWLPLLRSLFWPIAALGCLYFLIPICPISPEDIDRWISSMLKHMIIYFKLLSHWTPGPILFRLCLAISPKLILPCPLTLKGSDLFIYWIISYSSLSKYSLRVY